MECLCNSIYTFGIIDLEFTSTMNKSSAEAKSVREAITKRRSGAPGNLFFHMLSAEYIAHLRHKILI